jgi:plastocyanin
MASVAVLAAAACSSSSSTAAAPASTASSAGVPTAVSPSAVSTAIPPGCVDMTSENPFTITIQNYQYHPSCLIVSLTSRGTIINKDPTPHTFTITGTSVNALIQPNSTFTGNGGPIGISPGTYTFHCTIHTTMTGTIVVKQ